MREQASQNVRQIVDSVDEGNSPARLLRGLSFLRQQPGVRDWSLVSTHQDRRSERPVPNYRQAQSHSSTARSY